MTAGKLNFQAQNGDIASVQFEGGSGHKDVLFPQEGGVLATEQSVQTALDLISPTPLSISATLKGSFSLSNTIKSTIFDGFLYTGNGTSQAIITGMESVDFTVSSNGNGYWHDRTAGDCIIKNDAGAVIASGNLKLVRPISKVHSKDRTSALGNMVFDGLRGVGKYIYTSQTDAENYGSNILTSFNNNGFSLGSNGHINLINDNYVAYQTLYTHIRWGLTNQGKRYVEVYNPVSNEGMIMYIGSGVAGHQIPHSMGVEIDYLEWKSLTNVLSWRVSLSGWTIDDYFILNDSIGKTTATGRGALLTDTNIEFSSYADGNTLDASHIAYYKCKSETWTNGTYNGTGLAGNKIITRDVNGAARRPAWVKIKRIDSTGNWENYDNKRTGTYSPVIFLNASTAEVSDLNRNIILSSNGFTITTTYSDDNASGGKYYYEVYFDTDADGGGAEAELPTDTTQLQVAKGVFSHSYGVSDSGKVDNKITTFDGTFIPDNGWQE